MEAIKKGYKSSLWRSVNKSRETFVFYQDSEIHLQYMGSVF